MGRSDAIARLDLQPAPRVGHLAPSPTSAAHAPTQALDHVLLPAHALSVSMTVPAGSAEWAAAPDHLAMTVCFVLDEVQDGFT